MIKNIKVSERSVLIDGVEVASKIHSYEIVAHATSVPVFTAYAFAKDIGVELDAECYVVHPMSKVDAMKAAREYLLAQDPSRVEARMLDELQWGGPQKAVNATIATLLRGLDAEINELAPDAEVSGGADGGRVPDRSTEQ